MNYDIIKSISTTQQEEIRTLKTKKQHSNDSRQLLIDKVMVKGFTIKAAAEQLQINYNTEKCIINRYQKDEIPITKRGSKGGSQVDETIREYIESLIEINSFIT